MSHTALKPPRGLHDSRATLCLSFFDGKHFPASQWGANRTLFSCPPSSPVSVRLLVGLWQELHSKGKKPAFPPGGVPKREQRGAIDSAPQTAPPCPLSPNHSPLPPPCGAQNTREPSFPGHSGHPSQGYQPSLGVAPVTASGPPTAAMSSSGSCKRKRFVLQSLTRTPAAPTEARAPCFLPGHP